MDKAYKELYSVDFQRKLAEIQRLLAEAYEHYFEHESHCKSSEGAISIHLPEYFWIDDQKNFGGNMRPIIEIYSYVLGPNRRHYFLNIDRALREVRRWHKLEMEMNYDRS